MQLATLRTVLRRWRLPLLGILMLLAACGDASSPTVTPTNAPLRLGDAERGAALFQETLIGSANAPGCITCHSLAPDFILVGPSLAGIATRATDQVNEPSYTGTASDGLSYLAEAIVAPDAFVVEGFAPGLMPAHYATQLTPQEVADLIAYLATLY
jgi:nitric oxide reductase subunit C